MEMIGEGGIWVVEVEAPRSRTTEGNGYEREKQFLNNDLFPDYL